MNPFPLQTFLNFFVVVAGMTAEEMTAKRRAERKQFKLDRARAIAAAAAEAEAAFAGGRVVKSPTVIPSAATWKPAAQQSEAHVDLPESGAEADEEMPQDLEHLQLTFQEAFFLLWNFDCLTILEPEKVLLINDPGSLSSFLMGIIFQHEIILVERIWVTFQKLYISPEMPAQIDLQFDNPFLIRYVVYHHFRSLGWVVREGIKFCVDYLLYKRGPVFHHAE
jgi:tRNA-splicing endonuclease subunit Sen2